MTLREPRLGRVQSVVVTFDCGPDFTQSAAAILAECDGLVIVDNGSDPAIRNLLREFSEREADRVTLIENSANRGLDRAQNQGIAAARARGADWILLLDDDSLPQPGLLGAFAEALAQIAAPDRVAVLAPQLVQQGGAIATRYFVARGKHGAARRRLAAPILDGALFVIASGSLIRVAALDAAGTMREDFFIDYIDVEYGLRLNRLGWRIVIIAAARLAHRLGEPSRHRLLGRDIKTTNHDAARRFTIFRNRARLWRSYLGTRPGWVLLDAAAAVADLLRILAFETDKGAKLRRAFAGLVHGLTAPPL